MLAKDWTPAEAIYAFAGYLTTKREPVVLGASHDCGVVADEIKRFCDRHKLPEPRIGWETAIVQDKP